MKGILECGGEQPVKCACATLSSIGNEGGRFDG
jgi:hypothetical protein